MVFRASNRVFLGEPLCESKTYGDVDRFLILGGINLGRNDDWMTLMISIAMDTMRVSKVINRFPAILRP